MQKKYLNRILLITLAIIIILITAFMVVGFTKEDSATTTFDSYKDKWVKQDFKSMYSMLSR